MNVACAACSAVELEPGFLMDARAGNYTQWVQGLLRRGPLGGAKVMGKPRFTVDALRCRSCGFLNLYAREQA